MPRLPGIDEEATRLDGVGESAERSADGLVVGEELVEARDDADRGSWRQRGEAARIERVRILEPGDPPSRRPRSAPRPSRTLRSE
jgi:hypothetical protein